MSSELYELIALGMRYWFVLLGVLIVWRAARWAMLDHRDYRRTLRALPYAGLMGEIVNLNTGEGLPLPREGLLGSGKGCDVRLSGLRKREFEFALHEGHGVQLRPCHRQHQILLDGRPLAAGEHALHGARVELPGYQLRVRLFANLDIPQASRQPEDHQLEPQEASPEEFDMSTLSEDLGAYAAPATIPPPAAVDQEQQRALEMTWIHAIPPIEQEPEQAAPQPVRRRRRSSRHEE